jgi:antitoxin PrlF
VGIEELEASMKTTISTKGQVTIPKDIRDRLGLRPGTQLEFAAEGGKLVGRMVDVDQDPVTAVTGIIAAVDVDAYLDAARGPAESSPPLTPPSCWTCSRRSSST